MKNKKFLAWLEMTHSETFFASKEFVNNVHYKLIIRADDLANSMSTGMASKTKLALLIMIV